MPNKTHQKVSKIYRQTKNCVNHSCNKISTKVLHNFGLEEWYNSNLIILIRPYSHTD